MVKEVMNEMMNWCVKEEMEVMGLIISRLAKGSRSGSTVASLTNVLPM